MLSVSKLGAGQECYYLDAVAKGIEDYYSGRGESAGRWAGSAAGYLDLAKQVDATALREVLSGRDPHTGTPLGQLRRDRIPGFDLTFSAPKSVSVLWGLGDPDTARHVRAAHDVAVEAALGWLEREACQSRRGVDGHETVDADGFVAAAFVHRTSRAGDPQLHTHVLVANLAHCEDGKWRALDGRALLWQARTAGYLYKAHLRHELTARLGVDWGPAHKGAAEIVGVPADLCDVFSTRRHEIEDELAARGQHSPQAARVVALETRRSKEYGVDPGALPDGWTERARDAGHEPSALLSAVLHRTELSSVDDATARAGLDTLLGPGGLTAHSSVFDRRDVLRAWCDRLPRGAPIDTIETLTATTLHDSRVTRLEADAVYPKYTTRELVELERRLVNGARNALDQERAEVPEPALREALDARPELSPEQVTAVAALTTSGNGVDLLIAAAGTGKTFCLDAARDAWSRAGYRVVGAALAATAAAQLQTQAAIPSDTLALRSIQLAEGTIQLDTRTVVVVDEAAMAGTRLLVPILDAANAASAKVVLVGDPRQLNAIGAGGLLAGLERRLPTVALTSNRRQHEQWERDALESLRDGDIAHALAAYETHDRVITAPTAIDLRNKIAADWHAATLAGERAVILAERRYDVADLNRRVRERLSANHQLQGPILTVDGAAFQAGDRVLCLRNDRRLGVHNGTLATVTAVDPDTRSMTIHADGGARHHLPARYLDARHLTHGYALTIHKSQGLTVDRCLVLASDTLDRNAGYTALSRGRAESRIYLHGALPDPEAHSVDRRPVDPRQALTVALTRDRSDRLAMDHTTREAALRAELRVLHVERANLRGVRDTMPRDHSSDIDALTRTRDRLNAQQARTRDQLDTMRPGLRHRREHLAQRLVAERELARTADHLNDIEHALQTATRSQRAHDQYRHDHQPELRRLDRLETRIAARLDHLVDAVAADPPTHLNVLGTVPRDDERGRAWRDAAHFIEDYRAAHDVDDPIRPLGTAPTRPDEVLAWTDATRQLRAHCAGLGTLHLADRDVEPQVTVEIGI
jgi:conjugative relaxase-like TrwC/TraI family protein